MAQEDLAALLRRLRHDDPEALYAALNAGVPEIVGAYQAMAADSAAVFYGNTGQAVFDVAAVRAASQVNRQALGSAIRWAVFSPASKNVAGRLAGVIQKHVMSGSRSYILEQQEFQERGWWRHAQPGACAFCRMLATRSVREWGEYTGVSAQPEKFHDHCRCVPVLASEYEIPSYVEKWDEEYERAAKIVELGNGSRSDFKGILSLMRADGGDGSH